MYGQTLMCIAGALPVNEVFTQLQHTKPCFFSSKYSATHLAEYPMLNTLLYVSQYSAVQFSTFRRIVLARAVATCAQGRELRAEPGAGAHAGAGGGRRALDALCQDTLPRARPVRRVRAFGARLVDGRGHLDRPALAQPRIHLRYPTQGAPCPLLTARSPCFACSAAAPLPFLLRVRSILPCAPLPYYRMNSHEIILQDVKTKCVNVISYALSSLCLSLTFLRPHRIRGENVCEMCRDGLVKWPLAARGKRPGPL